MVIPKRGPKISLRIRQLIHIRALEEPKTPRDAVALHLSEDIERMGEISPSEDTLKKMISKERNREPNPLEQPWCLGTLSNYKGDFPPEVVPVLVKVQKLQKRSDWEGPKELTIRQAQWIARLYHLIREIWVERYPDKDWGWMVWLIANVYAKREEMSEIIGEKYFDTSRTDEDFFITEHFWGLPIEEMAAYYAATDAIYLAIQGDYGRERTKKHENKKERKDGKRITS